MGKRVTAKQKLDLAWAAAYSANVTITQAQAIQLIVSLFKGPPPALINPAKLPELLNLVTPPRSPPRKLR